MRQEIPGFALRALQGVLEFFRNLFRKFLAVPRVPPREIERDIEREDQAEPIWGTLAALILYRVLFPYRHLGSRPPPVRPLNPLF